MSWQKTFKEAGEKRETQVQKRKESESKFKTVEVSGHHQTYYGKKIWKEKSYRKPPTKKRQKKITKYLK